MTDTNSTLSDYPADWGVLSRRVVFIGLIFAFIIGTLLFLPLLNVTLIALLIVYGLYFPTRFITYRTGMAYGTSVIIVFVSFLLVAFGSILAVGIPLTRGIVQFISNLGTLFEEAIRFLEQYTPDQGWIVDNDGTRILNLNPILEPLSEIFQTGEIPPGIGEIASGVASSLVGAVGSIGGFVFLTIGVLTLAFYMMLELPMFFHWISNLKGDHRREVSILMDKSARLWGRYLYGIVVISFIGGVTTYIQVVAMGIGNPFVLSVLSALAMFIPIFGGYVAGFIVFFGAILTGSSWIDLHPILLGLFTWGVYTIIQGGLINSIVAPRIFGKSADVPVSIVIIGLVIFTLQGGFLGALLAVPVMAVIREVGAYLLHKLRGGDPFPDVPEASFVSEGLFAQPETTE